LLIGRWSAGSPSPRTARPQSRRRPNATMRCVPLWLSSVVCSPWSLLLLPPICGCSPARHLFTAGAMTGSERDPECHPLSAEVASGSPREPRERGVNEDERRGGETGRGAWCTERGALRGVFHTPFQPSNRVAPPQEPPFAFGREAFHRVPNFTLERWGSGGTRPYQVQGLKVLRVTDYFGGWRGGGGESASSQSRLSRVNVMNW
jgi:hypothetical protein